MAAKIDNLPLPGDIFFFHSPDAGQPDCLCSRCGKKIEEWQSPCFRMFAKLDKTEYRYHWGCIGGKDRTKEEFDDEQNDFYAAL